MLAVRLAVAKVAVLAYFSVDTLAARTVSLLAVQMVVWKVGHLVVTMVGQWADLRVEKLDAMKVALKAV